MRLLRLLPLLGILTLATLTGCAGTRTYTAEDLKQVKTVYRELEPVYVAFVNAYNRGDGAGIKKGFEQHKAPCALEDVIDHRDSMDPNVNLFAASADMDNWCNEIESGYARWQEDHDLPYDETVVPAGTDPFGTYQIDLAKVPAMIKHPGNPN